MGEEKKSEDRNVASEEVLESEFMYYYWLCTHTRPTDLFELSQTLNTGLSKETLSNSLELIDDGLDPSTLAVSGLCVMK